MSVGLAQAGIDQADSAGTRDYTRMTTAIIGRQNRSVLRTEHCRFVSLSAMKLFGVARKTTIGTIWSQLRGNTIPGRVVELADTPDLGSGAARRAGSSPVSAIKFETKKAVAIGKCLFSLLSLRNRLDSKLKASRGRGARR